jgi:hypothetical protein
MHLLLSSIQYCFLFNDQLNFNYTTVHIQVLMRGIYSVLAYIIESQLLLAVAANSRELRFEHKPSSGISIQRAYARKKVPRRNLALK